MLPLSWKCTKGSALLVLGLFILNSNALRAQTPSLWLLNPDTSWRASYVMMGMDASADWGSNVLDRNFMSKMVIGGHLNSAENKSLRGQMTQVNRLGAESSVGLSFYNFSDSLFRMPNLGLRVGVSMETSANVGFDRDFFALSFIGNTDFLGDTVDLGPLYADYQVFEKFGLGVFNKRNLSFIQLSAVNGQDMQSMRVDRMKMFTASDATSISLDYAGEYWQADTTKSGFGQTKGFGFALDGDLNMPLEDNRGVVSLSVRNLGYIQWNNETVHEYADTNMVWSGVNVDDVISLSENGFDMPRLKDTLAVVSDRASYVKSLPTSIQFRMIRKLNRGNSYEAGLRFMPNRVSIPFLYAGFNHFVAPGLMLTERLTYGGYGNLNVGLEAQWMIDNRVYLRAGTNQSMGFLFDTARGMNAFVGIHVCLNKIKEDIE